jgi:hypothetical protein
MHRFFLFLAIIFLFITPTYAKVILWTWNRVDDLSFVEPHIAKIAALAATFKITPQYFKIEPRLNRFVTPQEGYKTAVFRLEIDQKVSVNNKMIQTIIENIHGMSKDAEEIQIDFDATVSQRKLYKEILEHLNVKTSDQKVSMTALASWCVHDNWIDELPISHAVPMLYNMGRDGELIKRAFSQFEGWRALKCRGHIGISLSELSNIPHKINLNDYEVHIFNSRPWTLQDYETIKKRMLL